ncbi:sulfatase-like hydrolase/transferase [Verrucomicrobiaceae bacterium N1E253]|uniref:Sulfatase-like hydrolase/transferase n=1 Tax=Oceaniferula marina TaxID=2748318 RepID=A0A851GEZ0_9BACT|nr:sulfatase-like hydrolase/transferase [Oceaniferula marina]NWK54301.1 sulfatase-like hydrolase/transferase [Oceaniferula marina]
MRFFYSLLLVLLLGCPLLFAGKTPNLIFILIDDAGYDDFGFTGCQDWETPQIDRIATQGVRFDHAYVTASICAPSRAGLISGRYQQSFGFEENLTGGLTEPIAPEQFGLPRNVPTLGSLLQKKGYVTSVFGKWHLGEHDHFHPNNRGFDHFVGFLGGHRSFWPLEKPNQAFNLMNNREVVKTPEYLTDHLGKEAARFVRNNKEKPFFIYLAYNAVHSPLHARDEDLKALSSIEDKKRRVLGAMTIALDRSIGYVLDEIKQQGLEENTLIVFSNDNGGATYLKTNNGGFRGRKGSLWEGGIRVPYSLHWKGKVKPSVSNVPVNTLDISYTFCKQAGYSEDELQALKFSGRDLLNIDEAKGDTVPLFWRRGNTSAVRYGDWKLICFNNQPKFLFNLKSDQTEQLNLLKQHPEKATELEPLLRTWDASLPEPLWTKKYSKRNDQFMMRYWDQK